jgi:4-hydroxybenzoate polyprenyltransferase
VNRLSLIKIARPKQWIKNLMVFFPPFLGGALISPGIFAKGLVPFLAFCCASSTAYVFNDLKDLKRDTLHPRKKLRPLAAGDVTPGAAKCLFFLLLTTAFILGWSVSPWFFFYVVIYLIISFAYTLYLKQLPIFDVFCISLGFVLRLYGGGEAFGVYVSDWLFLSVFLLALFLSVGKRFSEQRILGVSAGTHRSTLEVYPEGFLESTMYLSGATVLITYAMYAITTPLMVYTVPLCAFGLLRYLMHVKAGGDGDPAEMLLKDSTLFTVALLWVIMVGLSVYR